MAFSISLPPRGHVLLAGAFLASISGVQLSHASSDDAWQEFQQDVERTCLAEAAPVISVNDIFVDPYGSESYGYAVIVGIGVGTSTGYMVVCTYDKLTQNAEVSGLFSL